MSAENFTQSLTNFSSSTLCCSVIVSTYLPLVLMMLLTLITICGNFLVIYAVATEAQLQSVGNSYIVSLALSDIIVGVAVMPASCLYILKYEWILGWFLCKVWLAIDYTASTASILNLLILSLDRYWSVTEPLLYMSRRTAHRARLMIAGVWFTSSLWTVPIFAWRSSDVAYSFEESLQCDTEFAQNRSFKIITSIFNFFLPLLLLYVLYARIYCEIRRRACQHFQHKHPGQLATLGDSLQQVSAENAEKTDPTPSQLTIDPQPNGIVSNHFPRVMAHSNGGSCVAKRKEKFIPVHEAVIHDSHTETLMHSYQCQPFLPVRPLTPARKCSSSMSHLQQLQQQQQRQWTSPVNNIGSSLNKGGCSGCIHTLYRNRRTHMGQPRHRDNKAIRQLGVILGAFTMCYMPYFTVYLLLSLYPHLIADWIQHTTTWIGYFNSTINPLLYAVCSHNFRTHFRKILKLSGNNKTQYHQVHTGMNRPKRN